jgi:MFS family permease
MLIGYLSDVIGRRLTMTLGLSVAIVGSLLCVFSFDSLSFLSGRFLEAIGASCFGLVHAIIRDQMTGQNANRIRIFISSLSGFLISTAPLFGAIIIEVLNWRILFSIFTTAAIITLIISEMFFKYENPITINEEANTFSSTLFWMNNMLGLFVFLIHFSFIILSVHGLMVHFSLSNLNYGLVMLIYGISFVVSGVLQTKFTSKLSLRIQKQLGLLFISLGTLFIFAVPYLESISYLMIGVSISAIGVSVLQPASVTASLDAIPASKSGLYTSFILLIRFGVGGLATSILLFDMAWSFNHLGEIYFTLFICVLILVTIINRLEKEINVPI